MTGYGRAHGKVDGREITVEIKSVNSKAKEVLVKASELAPLLEDKVRQQVTAGVARGRLLVFIRISEGMTPQDVRINEKVLGEYARVLRAAARRLHLSHDRGIKDLVSLPGVLRKESQDHFAPHTLARAEKITEAAIQSLRAAERREGLFLEKIFKKELQGLRASLKKARALHAAYVKDYTAALKKELSTLAAPTLKNELFARLQQEVSAVARNMDVQEELDRLQAHLESYALTMKEFPCGKKLDFIIQEMHREINTLSQKASLGLSSIAVAMKSSVEKMREQVQNVQ